MTGQAPARRWRRCAAIDALAAAGLMEVEIDGRRVLLAHDAGAVGAFQPLCPHDHARLCEGRIEAGRLVCPRHRARFRLADGGAEPGFELPALARYPVRVVDGAVEIDVRALGDPVRARWDLTRR